MKKSIWTVAVDDYRPDICGITLPAMEKYAERIGADFRVIRSRRWPQCPAPYEKLQIYDLGKDNDWNIVLDADMLIGDDMGDPTMEVPDNMVASWMCFEIPEHFPCNKYFYRDGRCLGIATNFLVFPMSCHDILTPFADDELDAKMAELKRPFILDEYCVSINAAKFGLKYCGILKDLANPPFKHLHLIREHDLQ